MVLGFGIALLLGLGPPPPSDTPTSDAICDLAVRSTTLDYAEFVGAATLRLPDVRLREANGDADPICAGQLHGYVELRSLGEDRWELSLISSDGRAWYRTVTSDPDQVARTLASALANLVAAIEDASAVPDTHAAELPAELEAVTETEPTPAESTPKPTPPEPSDPSTGPVGATPTVERSEPPLGRIRLELGPRLGLVGVLGIAPGPGLRGGGGGFGLDLMLPDGLAFGLDVRVLRSADAELRMLRTRVALGVGGIVRNGRFELPILVSGVVEPWQLRVAGDPTPLGQPPMIGGAARVAPGVLVQAGAVQLRLGLALGFEIVVEAAEGGVTPAIATSPTADPRLRAGGLELSGGLEIGVWLPIRERR